MLHVGIDSHTESLFGAFHEVASATAVNMHVHTTGNHGATFGINYFCPLDVEVDV